MTKYFFSIITSNLNSGNALAATAHSIKEQTFTDIQWIIADGASHDDSIALLKDIVTPDIDLTSEPDSGIYNAWNKSIQKIQGEWVLFLGAGDTFYNNHVLENVFKWIMQNPIDKHTILYGSVYQVNASEINSTFIDQKWRGADGPWIMGRPSLPCHQGVFHHAKLFANKPAYNEKLRIAADSEIVLVELLKDRGKDMMFPIVKMLAGGISDNKAHRAKMVLEIIKINYKLGIFFKRPISQIILLIVSWLKYSALGLHK